MMIDACPLAKSPSRRSRPHTARPKSHGASAKTEQEALDEQLPDEPHSPGAQRQAHGHLALARRRPRHEQAGDVAAGNQQQDDHHREQNVERGRGLTAERGQTAAGRREHDALGAQLRGIVGVSALPRGDVGMVANGQRRGNRRRLGCRGHAREQVQPLDVLLRRPWLPRVAIVPAGVPAVANRRLHHQRHPGVGASHRHRRAEELWSSHADDSEWRAVDGERLTDRIGRTAEAALPVAVADDGDRVTVEHAVVVEGQEAAGLGSLAEHVEVLARDELDRAALGGGRRRRPGGTELDGGYRARGSKLRTSGQLVAKPDGFGP